MAVTRSSDDNGKQQVEEGAEPSCREGADAGSCKLVQLRNPDGPSTGHQDIVKDTCGMLRSYKQGRKRKKDNESDSLSDIDDAEVFGYLNTKKEIHYKRLLWEAVNRNYTQPKKQKRATEKKKGVPVQKAAKTTDKVESQRPSSRINYDALRILNEELEQGSETAQMISADCYTKKTDNSPYRNTGQVSKDSSYNDGEMYHEHGDEQADDEYFDF